MLLLPHLGQAVRGWRRLNPGPHPWWAAGTATVALGLPLAITLAADVPLLAAPATFGALANLYGRAEPYRRRWRTQAWAGLGLTLAVLTGGLVAALPLSGWADVLVPALAVAAVATVAKFVTDAVVTGPPAGLIPVFATGTLTVEPLRFCDLPQLAAVTPACAALATALSCAAVLWRPDGPERTALARAVGAVLAALDDPRGRPAAAAAVHSGWAVLAAGRAGRPHRDWLAHAERVLHHGAGAPDVQALRDLRPRLAGRAPLPAAPREVGPLVPPAVVRWRAWAALRPGSVLLVPAVRVGIACAAAVLIADALGFGHGYWAAVGAAAALQSPSAGVTAQRAVQRAAGTLAGVAVAALLVPLAGSEPRLWACTVVCMFLVEFCMPRNYALGTVAITSLSLLLTRLGTTGAGVRTLVTDRIADTVLGVVLGVLVAVVVRNRHARAALEGAVAAVCRSGAERDPYRLRRDLLGLREARARLLDDDWRVPPPRAALDAVEEDGYRRLSELLHGESGTPRAAQP